MPRPPVAPLTVAVLLALFLPAAVAHAQRESFDGLAARAQAKAQQDRALDLNGDGTVDDHERALATQNLLLQNAVNPNTGEIDREKLKRLQANRKRLEAEARARDRAEAVVEKLREKQARGHQLTTEETARIRAFDEAKEARRQEREREAREAAKTPRTQAAQRLSQPILSY